MPLAIAQRCLDPTDLRRAADLAAEAGAEGFCLSCHQHEAVAALDSEEAARVVQAVTNGLGLAIPSIDLNVLSASSEGRLAADDQAAERAGDTVRRAISAAARLGRTETAEGPAVLLPLIGRAAVEVDAELERVVELLTEPAELAEEAGVCLGVLSGLNFRQSRYLLDSLAPYGPVRVAFDAASLVVRKIDPPTFLRQLPAEEICQVRLRDVGIPENGQPPRWSVALGSGDVDFRAVFQALRAIGYEGWYAVDGVADPDAARADLEHAVGLLS
jgi:sugar phosphate isomerase/epimerase